MDHQTETLLEAAVGLRFKLTPLDLTASDEDVVERLFATWNAGHLGLSDTLKVPNLRVTGDHGDMEVEVDRSIIKTLWVEREGRDIEIDELRRLQVACEEALRTAASTHGIFCTPLPAKYVRRVDHMTLVNLKP